MSHISEIDMKFTELDALLKAAHACGLVKQDRTVMNWYGDFAGDTEESRRLIAEGVSPREYEQCDFVLARSDAFEGAYNIGVRQLEDGSYVLRFDSWGNGQHLVDACGGLGLNKLCDEYTAAVAEDQFLRDGYQVRREVDAQGQIDVVAFD